MTASFSSSAIAYKSVMPGVAFPAVPSPHAATLLALQYQFEQSERWPRAQIRAMQFRQMENVLRHVWQMPFWRERLENAGYGNAGITEEIFARIPLLTRADIQNAGIALHAPSVPQGHGKIHAGETSGSTGRPVSFLSAEIEQIYWQAFTLRDHFWHKRDFSGKLGAIRWMEQSGTSPGWGPSTDHVLKTGTSASLKIDTPISEQLAWLQRERPDYLLSYASNIAALAHASRQQGLKFSNLREVRSVSETVRPELRELVRDAWDVRLVDMYTTKEAGYLALQCPQHDYYHVQEENVLLEILDDNNQPCAPGVPGRVVVTALNKFAMPLIRYEVGDYAMLGESACSCGRTLLIIKEVLGRTRNMLRLPNGEQRWPLCDLVEQPDVPGILQYQYVQKTIEDIEVRLVTSDAYSRDMEPRLTEIIHQRLGHPFKFKFVYLEEIARSKAGKFEDFMSLL